MEDYKTVLHRQEDGSWVAEIPASPGGYALLNTREEALAELSGVFRMISEEYSEKGLPLRADTTEIVHAWRHRAPISRCGSAIGILQDAADGSHERSNHPAGRAVTIPLYGGEIGPPLFFKILRQLRISLEEFQRLR